MAAKNSIAVLPFVNASSDPDLEYLSDGISESLINSLSQLQNVRVLARSTMFTFKGKEANPQQVGKLLGVETVLTGRVVQRGDSLTVQADLVNVADGSQLWGERYSRKVSFLLAVQEGIAREISERLRQKLSGEERERVTKRYTENVEAYQLYLRGRYHLDKLNREGFDKAAEFFYRAIERDPNYALAYAGLSECYQSASGRMLPNKEAQPKARDAALTALRLDDTLAEAHSALGAVKMFYDWDFEGAEKEYRRAIELNPNYATAYKRYAFSYQAKGQTDESLEVSKKAHQLDPLSLIVSWDLGFAYMYARQFDRAEEQFRRTLEIDPNFSAAHEGLGWVYLHQAMYEKAIEEFTKAAQRENRWSYGGRGRAYAKSGNRAEAMKLLNELKSAPSYVSPFAVAIIYIGLGDKDAAFEWMNKAADERDDSVVFLRVDPVWDEVRSDTRFADLVSRVGLPQYARHGSRSPPPAKGHTPLP